MPLFVIGLNHNSAPLPVRDRMVFASEALKDSLQDLKSRLAVGEAVIVSTCNRTELYANVGSEPDIERLIEWLCETQRVDADWLRPHLYSLQNDEALQHLLRVAAGLDSLILGEPQILGQTKTAFAEATEAGTVGQILGRAFQHAFAVAKQIRTETEIGSHPVSVAFAAVSLARQIFGDLSQARALLVGAGETMELTARHLKDQGIGRMAIANRTVEKARAVAAEHDAAALTLSEIPEQLQHSDIVITSTASPLPIIGKGSVERALKIRKHKPILMVDLAVPRDIEAEVEKLDDVYLYTVDDLREVIEDNLRSRREAAQQAEKIIAAQSEQFKAWVRSLQAAEDIRQLRTRAERQSQDVLERAIRRLGAGESPEEAMKYLAHTLTNKLMHTPTKGLREIVADGDEHDMEVARRLLDIKHEDQTTP